MLDIVELVFAAGARIVGCLSVGVRAGIEVDVGIDLIALIFLRTDEVGPGQRAGIEIDLAIARNQAGCGEIGIAADCDVLVAGRIKTGGRVDPVGRALAGAKARLHAAQRQTAKRRADIA